MSCVSAIAPLEVSSSYALTCKVYSERNYTLVHLYIIAYLLWFVMYKYVRGVLLDFLSNSLRVIPEPFRSLCFLRSSLIDSFASLSRLQYSNLLRMCSFRHPLLSDHTFFGILDTIIGSLRVVPSVLYDLDWFLSVHIKSLKEQFPERYLLLLSSSSRWNNWMKTNRKANTSNLYLRGLSAEE